MSGDGGAQAAIAYLHSADWRGSKPGLSRMRQLLGGLGNPQQGMKFVHVAGTNGKGSTCAMVAAVLRRAGYRVGLNTSPFVLRFHERVQVNGEMISDGALAALTAELRVVIDTLAESPTEFERITALALLYFRRQNCDIVVLEVGMGGEWDASNVIDCPEVAVITAIGMDHVKELGPALGNIAAAKAGIVKPGGSVVSYGDCPEGEVVIADICRARGAQLRVVDASRLGAVVHRPTGSSFTCPPYGKLELPLAGSYQPKNALVALTALEVLREKGWKISKTALREGLASVCWPGRFERLRLKPEILLDGAHNPQGMAAAAESLRQCYPGRQVVFLLGFLRERDAEAMLRHILPLAAAFVLLRPESERAMEPAELAVLLRPHGKPVFCEDTAAAGLAQAVALAGQGGLVCALGSLYLSGAVRRAAEEID